MSVAGSPVDNFALNREGKQGIGAAPMPCSRGVPRKPSCHCSGPRRARVAVQLPS